MHPTQIFRLLSTTFALCLSSIVEAQQAVASSAAPVASAPHPDLKASFEFAAKLQQAKPPTSEKQYATILPSSDFLNRPQSEVYRALTQLSNPATAKLFVPKAYTNYRILRLQRANPAISGQPTGISPQQVAAFYGFSNGSGNGRAIAIVDSFQYPSAEADLLTFTQAYGLKECSVANTCLSIYPSKQEALNYRVDCSWNGEAALDLQWAHAIAPDAKIILVQAASTEWADLAAAVATARDKVIAAGGGAVSMSFTFPEFPGELDDSTFSDGVLYFAASGDDGGFLAFPAASPRVISVGGTGLVVSGAGVAVAEHGWSSGGGGVSQFEAQPSVQQGVPNVIGTMRNIPDISANAGTGVGIYVGTPAEKCNDERTPRSPYIQGWTLVVGTSISAPLIAAMTIDSGRNRSTVNAELQAIYANRGNAARIRDIVFIDSSAGSNTTKVGYDNVTGIGSPIGPDFDAP